MKKGLSILLAVLMAFSLTLTACQSKKADSQITKEATSQKPLERVKLRMFIPGSSTPVPPDIDIQNNKWADIYKKAFPEVDFEFLIFPSAAATEKKTLMIASGDFPDMLPVTQMEIINWSKQGIIMPLDDIVKKEYPNVLNFLKPADLKIAQYEGKQWAMPVPANHVQNPNATYIRKDWLEKLKLQVPTTVDEAYEVMKAFVTKDPDGNGKNDTFGVSGVKNLANLWYMFSPYDVQMNWYTRVNGKLMPDNIRPEMKEALANLRKLYADGLLDKDTLVQTGAQLAEKSVQSKVGIVGATTWTMNGTTNQALAKATPGGELMTLPPLKGPKGIMEMADAKNTGNLFAVSSTCKNPAYPAKILNWLLAEDKTKSYYALNADLLNCGEVGLHATVTGKYIANMSESQLSEAGKKDIYRYAYRVMYGSMNMFSDENQLGHAAELIKAGQFMKYFLEDKQVSIKYAKPDARLVTGPVAAEFESQLNTYFDEVKLKIVTGTDPIEAFDKWVDYFNKNGGDRIIEESNKLNPAQ